MGTKIEVVATAAPFFSRIGRDFIGLASRAARSCLKNATFNPDPLDIIINTGIYREKHLIEPAVAALIQGKIAAYSQLKTKNRSCPEGLATTFSFDLNNGGCGLVSGMQVVDGFIRSGKIRRGMIVAGDSEPIPGMSQAFGFAPTAAALILSPGNHDEGFTRFKISTFPQGENAYESRVAWTSLEKKDQNPQKRQNKNRNILLINKKECYLEQCVECAAQSLENFSRETGLRTCDIDLILPSQSPGGFPAGLKKRTGLGERVIEVDRKKGELHTAGPAVALDRVWRDHRFKEARHVMFITVGPGITTAIALYKNNLDLSR
jgi:3-oxoacyl-[acyl-carrier-protein] synthase-3